MSETARCDLTVVRAAGLAAMDLNGLSDPFVQVFLHSRTAVDSGSMGTGPRQTRESLKELDKRHKSEISKVVETSVLKKTLDPDWEKAQSESGHSNHHDMHNRAAFDFVPGGKPQLQIRVFDHDTLDKDDFIGMANLASPLEDFAGEGEQLLTLTLEADVAEKKSPGNRGTVTIRLTVTDVNELGLAAHRVFGVPLEALWKEGGSEDAAADDIDRYVPQFLRDCVAVIVGDEEHLRREGIFRLSGSAKSIAAHRGAVNRGVHVDLRAEKDLHTITGLLKLFLREMPEPLFPFNVYDAFVAAAALPSEDLRLLQLRQLIHGLPRGNFVVGRYLIDFLLRVETFSDSNKMGAENLATVFGPNLLAPEGRDTMRLMQDTPAINNITCLLIKSPFLFASAREGTALYSFEPEGEGELALREGDGVLVWWGSADGWLYGSLDASSQGVGAPGRFPASYVRVDGEEAPGNELE